jgi:hypothetical protein
MDKLKTKIYEFTMCAGCQICNFSGEHGLSSVDITDEITTLRQQLAEIVKFQSSVDRLASKQVECIETLALRDLEIVKLREALESINECCIARGNDIYIQNIIEQALSTTFTPDHLNEWLREQVGEPVAWHCGGILRYE